jgi:lambda family phage portal protein
MKLRRVLKPSLWTRVTRAVRNAFTGKRRYDAGMNNRLLADFRPPTMAGHAAVRESLELMRNRSRALAENNDFMRSYLTLLRVNILGPSGMRLSLICDASPETKKMARQKREIEAAWKRWTAAKNASLDRRHSFRDIEGLVVAGVARDGEALVRVVAGSAAPNEFRFALQLLEPDLLDEKYDDYLSNGNRVVSSVEINSQTGTIEAFWLLTQHPGDPRARVGSTAARRVRVPASEIIHLARTERPTDYRGVPWAHSSITRLHNLAAYEQAEMVGARAAAATLGVALTSDGEVSTLATEEQNGRLQVSMEPGSILGLPPNITELKEWQHDHDAQNYEAFTKQQLRAIASGLGVSPNSLGKDYSDVNFSSLREGRLVENDYYREVQRWLIEHFHERVFDEWLRFAVLSNSVRVRPSDVNLYHCKFRARGWAWIDPLKDATANAALINAALASRTDILAEQGQDFEETAQELAAEANRLKELGLPTTTTANAAPAAPAAPTAAPREDDADADADADDPAEDDDSKPATS